MSSKGDFMKYFESLDGKRKVYCPRCEEHTEFKRIKIQRFFTVGSLQLFPVSKAIPFLECPVCCDRYPEALILASQVKEALFLIAAKNVMSYMAISDGHVDSKEVKLIEKYEREILNYNPSEGEVEAYINNQKFNREEILTYLSDISNLLTELDKENILKCGFYVLAADGKIEQQEKDFLVDVAICMGFSELHYKSFIKSLSDE